MIKWIEKSRNNSKSNADVTIKTTRRHKDSDELQMCMTFRNDCEKKITKTGFVMVGYDDERMYFVQAIDGESGFKFTGKTSKNKNKYLKIVNDDLIKFVGDYPLLKDVKSGMYYIQKGE